MYILIPGRHHVLTNFQASYLNELVHGSTNNLTDVDGQPVTVNGEVEAVIFAVTSANHSNTRRNPLPFYMRAIAIEAFGNALNIPTYIYGVDDVGSLPSFASYTLKRIKHESELRFDLTPQNTIVVCSTPVMKMYETLGFQILPAELENRSTWTYKTALPWDIVERIASQADWEQDQGLHLTMHSSSINVWSKYRLGDKVQTLFRDSMISGDGDLTATRDYNSYVRQMDEIAEMKYHDTAGLIQAGRIGDIGCAVGSWIKEGCADDRFRESDFYGVEVSRHLYEICQQRKFNGEFANPFVFFSQRNAVTGLAFERDSMNTIHTSSLTHEIESYGSRTDLLQFIRNRYDELAHGGIWINRDVVGPEDGDKKILLWLNEEDGNNLPVVSATLPQAELKMHLEGLSTYGRFLQFAHYFRRSEGYILNWSEKRIESKRYPQLSLRDATEFLSRKDYIDNWQSEMHETFCFWDFEDWKRELQLAGFVIHPQSKAFTNDWIVQNRWEGKAAIYTEANSQLEIESWPVTTMFLFAVKN